MTNSLLCHVDHSLRRRHKSAAFETIQIWVQGCCLWQFRDHTRPSTQFLMQDLVVQWSCWYRLWNPIATIRIHLRQFSKDSHQLLQALKRFDMVWWFWRCSLNSFDLLEQGNQCGRSQSQPCLLSQQSTNVSRVFRRVGSAGAAVFLKMGGLLMWFA